MHNRVSLTCSVEQEELQGLADSGLVLIADFLKACLHCVLSVEISTIKDLSLQSINLLK